MTQQTIYISTGAVEPTWSLTVTDLNGEDISGNQIMLSVGTFDAPDSWFTPDIDPPQEVVSQRVVQLTIGGTIKPVIGLHHMWSQLIDGSDVITRRHDPISIA